MGEVSGEVEHPALEWVRGGRTSTSLRIGVPQGPGTVRARLDVGAPPRREVFLSARNGAEEITVCELKLVCNRKRMHFLDAGSVARTSTFVLKLSSPTPAIWPHDVGCVRRHLINPKAGPINMLIVNAFCHSSSFQPDGLPCVAL
jgi:hypothetical protein